MRRSKTWPLNGIEASVIEPFLRIPPFPGSRAPALAVAGQKSIDDATADELVRLLAQKRVGGTFWGGQPSLPQGRDLLLAPTTTSQAVEMLEAAEAEGLLGRCLLIAVDGATGLKSDVPTLHHPIDYWHIAQASDQVWAGSDHELALVAALAQRPLRTFGQGRFEGVASEQGLVRAIRRLFDGWAHANPYTGEEITVRQAIELLSAWRSLVDRNRSLSAVLGIAGWKRPTVDPMLWDGTTLPRYAAAVPEEHSKNEYIGAWTSRISADLLDRVQRSGLPVAEIEDGMIRGRGLGANCVPPLSIVVDFSGIYFDPNQPSDLELILETTELDDALVDRASHLRRTIVEAGISKYGGGVGLKAETGTKHRILVVGQVEDDRSILSGGAGQTNLGLLKRARTIEPDAWLIYRPHPDVEAGHRKGHVADHEVLKFADEIDRGSAINDLIEAVKTVHCITSLAGFEALLRGKKVTTHGVPFYAGWGLTTDLGPIPPRRTRRRSLDELVAAALILYPTYVDPVTRLPCPPEILVRRIARGQDGIPAPLAGLRAFQGKMKVALRRVLEAAR